MASEMSDDMSEVGAENEVVPVSSASSISNDPPTELATNMSETEDSNSCLEPSSSETDSCLGTKVKEDGSCKSSSSDMTVTSANREQGDDGSASGSKVKFPVRPGIVWKKGERLEAQDYQLNWYSSKIMNINEERKEVLIHFEGWNQRYDDWMEMDSERLRPLTRHSERRDKRRRGKTVYKVGEKVQAKWTDCKMYPAMIDDVLDDGSYMVLFYDGFKKNIQPINLRPAPLHQKIEKFQIEPPVLSPKDLKCIKTKPVEFKVTDEKHASWRKTGKIKGKTGVAPEGSGSASGVGQSSDKVRPSRATGQGASNLKKSKLIVSGSLFSKRVNKGSPSADAEKEDIQRRKRKDSVKLKQEKQPAEEVKPTPEPKVKPDEVKVKPGDQVKVKEEEEVKVKQEEEKVPVEEEVKVDDGGDNTSVEVAAEAPPAVGTENSSQTYTTAPVAVKKPVKRRQRSGSFPGEKRKRRRLPKGPRPPGAVVPRRVKKALSTDTTKSLGSPVSPTAPALLPLPEAIVPSKAFRVEVDHNTFKCQDCGKGFRKSQLLNDHIKHYHKPEGLNDVVTPTARKRKKTLSTCSTDSDLSLSSKSNSTKRRRHISEISVGSPDVAMKMSFDEDGPASVGTESVTENAVVEAEEDASYEIVNCICGIREETGTMIQCDCCQCWQHTQCYGYTDVDLNSDIFLTSYVCSFCKFPPGVRDSCKYLYDMDWFRKGQLARFSFVGGKENEERNKDMMTAHDLMAELLNISKILHSLREQISIAGEREHPELRLWEPQPPKESCSVGVCTSDDKDEDPESTPEVAMPEGTPAVTNENVDMATALAEGTASAVCLPIDADSLAANIAAAAVTGETTLTVGEQTSVIHSSPPQGAGEVTVTKSSGGEVTVSEGSGREVTVTTSDGGEATVTTSGVGKVTVTTSNGGENTVTEGCDSKDKVQVQNGISVTEVTGDREQVLDGDVSAPIQTMQGALSVPESVVSSVKPESRENVNDNVTGVQSSKPDASEAGCTNLKPDTGGVSSVSSKPDTGGVSSVSSKPDTGGVSSVSSKPDTGGVSSVSSKPDTGGASSVSSKPDTGGVSSVSSEVEVDVSVTSGDAGGAAAAVDREHANESQSDCPAANAALDKDKGKEACPVNQTVDSSSSMNVNETESLAASEQEPEEEPGVVPQDPLVESKLALLTWVQNVHDEVSNKLDQLDNIISGLERQEFGVDAAGCYTNIYSLKHSLNRLTRDLTKVKHIASYR